MRWTWFRRKRQSVVVISWTGSELAFVHARPASQGQFDILRCGSLTRGSETEDSFFQRIDSLGFAGCALRFVLRPDQYQLLQIEAPEVPPEEIRAAARWKIRDLVDVHLDDLTLDVCRVGDPTSKGVGQLFVVAARSDLVRELTQMGQRLQCRIQAIDIWDMAQRNLQSLVARKGAPIERAEAALAVVDSQHSILTISARGELYYSRRIDLPAGFLESRWVHEASVDAVEVDSYEEVPEYVPSDSMQPLEDLDTFQVSRHGAETSADDGQQRLVVEVQRSLDVWERTWSALPLDGLKVFAGHRSRELAMWLGRQMGTPVAPLDVNPFFPGFAKVASTEAEQSRCWPLLGALLRDNIAKS